MDTNKEPNRLIHSSSPYLLQHAYNPVDWYPWGQEALELAQKQDRPIIVSIGYSACHWCHVMERESFENEQVADIMNAHFVSIKVDREERPDVDQIYMEAIQLMGSQGGWPLNVILMPNGKPFYGGTYFPPQNWAKLLLSVAQAFKTQRDELEQAADELANGVARSDMERFGLQKKDSEFSLSALNQMFEKLAQKFDTEKGGMNRAPKFPMPNIYFFLLRYYTLNNDAKALKQIKLTLDEMAYGGIYDQIGGGFARYSVDAAWFTPHFEKMLYDNAQLLSLYAEVFTLTKDSHYKHICEQTFEFLIRELQSQSGGFFSALDADSEGVEGKFYTWTYQELKDLIQDKFDLFVEYYDVTESGNWEDGVNILHRSVNDQEFSDKHILEIEKLTQLKLEWEKALMKARDKRVRPGLDDKQLTSWNGLLLKGLCDTYQALGEEKYLDTAIHLAQYLDREVTMNQNQLLRTFKEGKASIKAYLEDYAAVIQGYVSLYQACFDAKWLKKADLLTKYVLEHFWDEAEGLFFFTDKSGEELIARKKEIFDNVISSSNSIMANNLYVLGLLLDNTHYTESALEMMSRLQGMLAKEVHYLCNWAVLYANLVKPTVEVAIIGEQAFDYAKQIRKDYFPNSLVVATKEENDDLPLLTNRKMIEGKTTFYVCRNKACQLPTTNLAEALRQMQD